MLLVLAVIYYQLTKIAEKYPEKKNPRNKLPL